MHPKLSNPFSFSAGIAFSFLIQNGLGGLVCPDLPATTSCHSIGVDPVFIDPVTATSTTKYIAVCPDDKHTSCGAIGISPVSIPAGAPADQTSVLKTSVFTVTPTASATAGGGVPIVIPVVVPVPVDPVPPPIEEPDFPPEEDEPDQDRPKKTTTTSAQPGPTEDAFPYLGYNDGYDTLFADLTDALNKLNQLPEDSEEEQHQPDPEPTFSTHVEKLSCGALGSEKFKQSEAQTLIDSFCTKSQRSSGSYMLDSSHREASYNGVPAQKGIAVSAKLHDNAECNKFSFNLNGDEGQYACKTYLEHILKECDKDKPDDKAGGSADSYCIQWGLAGYSK